MPQLAGDRRIIGFALEQPRALEATLLEVVRAARGLRDGVAPHDELVLVGSGTSKNALISTAPTFRRTHRLPVAVRGPSEFLSNPDSHAPRTLVIVLSQTGTSTTTVAALEAAQASGLRTIALTAEADSPFGTAAETLVVMPIGPEDIGPKTKGYTASLVALLAVAEVTAPDPPAASCLPGDPSAYVAWFAASLPGWRALGRDWAERYSSTDHIMLIGDQTHLGTVLEASLKLQEMAGLAASAFDLEEALHGRLHGLGPTSLALFVCGDADSERLALATSGVMAELGVPTLVVSSNAGTEPAGGAGAEALVRLETGHARGQGAELAPVSTIVPFQFFAEQVARMRKIDPDQMHFPGLSARLGIKLLNT